MSWGGVLFLIGAALALLAVYALWIEPAWRLKVVRYRLHTEKWRGARILRVAVISDLHAGAPHITLDRIDRIVAKANALEADLAILLGDYGAGHGWTFGAYNKAEIAQRLKGFTAPLGTFAILGNHDWWQDPAAQKRGEGPIDAQDALESVGIPVLENRAVRLGGEGGFWLVGLGDQRPFSEGRDGDGMDDLETALGQVRDDAPVLLLAHEPDIFPNVTDRPALTLSGHTHGGQIRLFGWSPVIEAAEDEYFGYGLFERQGRHLIVSGGIGCSVAPFRFNLPPEINLIEIAGVEDGAGSLA